MTKADFAAFAVGRQTADFQHRNTMGAGNLYIACGDWGEQKSVGKMKSVWGEWSLLVKD